MERKELGSFYAYTFDEEEIEFIVYNDDSMECPTIGSAPFDHLILKPRFEMRTGRKHDFYDAPAVKWYEVCHLVKEWKIDEDLFEYLKERKMIKYSTDMAYLYGFSDQEGFDIDRKKSPFKWAKKKLEKPLLDNQKRGYFN